jgi:hypothetical protein
MPNVQSLRGDRLSLIGAVSGSAAMYRAMTSLGFASGSGCNGPIKLDDDPMDASRTTRSLSHGSISWS